MKKPIFRSLLICLLLASTLQGQAQEKRQGRFWQYFRSSEDPYKGRIVPIPLLIYSPETSFGFGLSAQYLFRFKNTDSTSNLSVTGLTVMYTLKKQFIIHPNWDLFFNNQTYRFTGDFLYQRYPDSFYGIGNNTRRSDQERYTTKYILLKARATRRVVQDLYLGLQYRLEYMFDPEYKAGGLFENNDIPGEAGFRASGVGVAIIYDSRDNTMYPFHGYYITVSNHFYRDWLGSTVEFDNVKLDARLYFNPGKGSHIIALNGYMELNNGDPPFMMLSKLGGEQIMRGHFYGRYRERQILAAQLEYRFPIWWRFIGVAFTGVGDVAHTFNDFALNDLKYSFGGGLRFTLDSKERINVRFDAAFGLHGARGFYFGIGEAF